MKKTGFADRPLRYTPAMVALATLLPDAKSLPRADKLRLIQLLAADLAEADAPVPALRPLRVPSPRLARPADAADFVKQVQPIDADAAV